MQPQTAVDPSVTTKTHKGFLPPAKFRCTITTRHKAVSQMFAITPSFCCSRRVPSVIRTSSFLIQQIWFKPNCRSTAFRLFIFSPTDKLQNTCIQPIRLQDRTSTTLPAFAFFSSTALRRRHHFIFSLPVFPICTFCPNAPLLCK